MARGYLNCTAEGRVYERYCNIGDFENLASRPTNNSNDWPYREYEYRGPYIWDVFHPSYTLKPELAYMTMYDYRMMRGAHSLHVTQLHDIFTSIVKALSSATAQSLGIYRRASNYGHVENYETSGGCFHTDMAKFVGSNILTKTGHGFERWDDPDLASGNNAWAVFEFSSSTSKFWVLVQYSGTSVGMSNRTFGQAPGNPAYTAHYEYKWDGGFSDPDMLQTPWKNQCAVAVSVAYMPNGTSPWNGTSNDDGLDTKGSLVWKADAVKFPRGNDKGGLYIQENADHMIPLIHEMAAMKGFYRQVPAHAIKYDTYDTLYNIIFDEENLLITFDMFNNGSINGIFYFGKYTPLDAMSNQLPYVCMHREAGYSEQYDPIYIADDFENQKIFADSTSGGTTYNEVLPYGCINSSWPTGIENPSDDSINSYVTLRPQIDNRNLLDGGVHDPYTSHSKGFILTIPATMKDTINKQKHVWNDSTYKCELYKPAVVLMEIPQRYGYLGNITFFNIARHVESICYTGAGVDTKLIVGQNKKSSYKLVIPWSDTIDYGEIGDRNGTLW